MEEYKDVFSDMPGKTLVIEVKIVLTTGVLVGMKPYHILLHFKKQGNNVVLELLRLNITEETVS